MDSQTKKKKVGILKELKGGGGWVGKGGVI